VGNPPVETILFMTTKPLARRAIIAFLTELL
jgi:hypothetical protein